MFCFTASISLAGVVALTATGCGLGRAQAPRPDLAGTWDVVYDDRIEVELHHEGHVQKARLGRVGGSATLHEDAAAIELVIDCARAELLCPHEILGSELRLTSRMGDVSDAGDLLVLPLHGEGLGECRLLPGSAATAHIEFDGSHGSAQAHAAALSDGRVKTRFSVRCLPTQAGGRDEFSEAMVTLSTKFTALRR